MSDNRPSEPLEQTRKALVKYWPNPLPSASARAEILQRIEAKERRRAWPWLLVAAACVALLFFFVTGERDGRRDSLASIENAEFVSSDDAVFEVLQNDSEGVRIALKHGRLRSKVQPLREGQFFIVTARDVEVSVVGTDFELRMEGQRVQVEAFAGRVRVHALQEDVVLRAPSVWPKALVPRSGQRSESAVDAGQEQIKRVDAGNVEAKAKESGSTTKKLRVGKEKKRATANESSSNFKRAKDFEGRGEYAQALVLYREIADSRGTLAQDSLYAMGRIFLRSDLPQARATFAEYTQLYPNGRYLAAVYVHLADLWSENPRKLRVFAQEFLAKYPKDARAPRFETILEKTEQPSP